MSKGTDKKTEALSVQQRSCVEDTLKPPCKYPHCAYPCPDLPDCRDAEQPAQGEGPTDCDDPFAEIYDEAKKGTEAYTAPPPQRQTLPDGIPSPDELEALSDGNDGMLLNEGFPEKLDRLARWLREYAAAPAPLAEQPAQGEGRMKRLPKGHKAQIMGTRMFQTMYTAEQMRKFAQQSKPWVSLTDEEVRAVRDSFGDEPVMLIAFARAIEAKLRKKNA